MIPEPQIELPDRRAATEPCGAVFNIMRFSLRDGPGIRTTVFFKGCPLSCRWCHNPESRNPRPELMYFRERCRLCGDCVAACPHGALQAAGGEIVRSSTCEYCGGCADTCRAGARELLGRTMTAGEVIREIERDVIFFDESGGGVSFSGGEPLSQPAFLEALLVACRARGIHTVLDTCGFAPTHDFLRIARRADLVLFDVKTLDNEQHKNQTGVSNHLILRNLEELAAIRHPIVVRVPIVPGITDSDQALGAAAGFLARIGLRRVDLLPYHATGVEKYRRLGVEYPLPGTQVPSHERMREIAETFERNGFAVTIGG